MEPFEVEDILGNLNKKKKLKSGKKGKRVELQLVKDLNERFDKILSDNPDWGKFSRSVGSGNRWGQKVELSKAAKNTYTGDVVCPENFRFTLESKGGYNDIDLCSAFEGGSKEIDTFLQQVNDDSLRCEKFPLLLWKKDRKPRLAILRSEHIKLPNLSYFMVYREWTVLAFRDLMELEDRFFFQIKE